jgi:hypothetical protein
MVPLLSVVCADAQPKKMPKFVPEDPELYYAFFRAHTDTSVKIKASNAAAASQLTNSTAALYDGTGGPGNLGDTTYNSVGHNPWAILDNPSIVPDNESLDCISQTTIVAVQTLQVGVNSNVGAAFPTSDYDATEQEKQGAWTLDYVGATGNPYYFEGFLYICGVVAGPGTSCQQTSPNIISALTVWVLQGPFGAFSNFSCPQCDPGRASSAYYGITFNTMYLTLRQALQYAGPGRSPKAGQQWRYDGSNYIQQVSFPVQIQ